MAKWNAAQAAAERQAKVAAFVEAQPYLHWGCGRRLVTAAGIFVLAQLPVDLFLAALLWRKDPAGVMVSVGFVNALLLPFCVWFIVRPRSFAKARGREANPAPIDPNKWNPWLGGGA